MKLVKLRINTKAVLDVFKDGILFEDKKYKFALEDGMDVITCPEELATRLLSKSGERYSLLSPSVLKVQQRSIRGTSVIEIKSVSKQIVNGDGPEDDALALIAKIKGKYDALDWNKERFIEFCEENNIEVKGNWGIPKMIETLVKFDSELEISLEEYLG